MVTQTVFTQNGNGGVKQSIQGLVGRQEYSRAAHLVETARAQAEITGKREQARLLATIYQICLICQQQRESISNHYLTYETAVQREQALRQQLENLVQLLTAQDTVARVQAPSFTSAIQDRTPASALPEAATEAQLTVYCFGVFRVYENGRLLDDWSSQKAKAIFKYMLQRRERPVHREELMNLFWPNDDPKVARRNLYQAIYMLRQSLQAHSDIDYIHNGDGRYQIDPGITLWVDSEVYQRHYQTGQRLEAAGKITEAVLHYSAADNLYEGDYLVEDIYEEWTLGLRENLKLASLDILDRLSQYYWEQGNHAACITACRKILDQDNCREDAHRRLMHVYMQLGQRHLALRQYHQCLTALADELAVDPMPATLELYQLVLNAAQNGGPVSLS